MKTIKNVLGVFVFAMALLTVPTISVLASGNGGSTNHNFESGRDFGQHVSDHAQLGHIGQNMNPGTHHRGFSPWAPGN